MRASPPEAERTPDGRHIVVDGRRWRTMDPGIPDPLRAELVELMAARRTRQRARVQANRLVKTCDVVEALPVSLARRTAALRTAARPGSAVDALVVATAEPGGVVLTGDPDDLEQLAAASREVRVRPPVDHRSRPSSSLIRRSRSARPASAPWSVGW